MSAAAHQLPDVLQTKDLLGMLFEGLSVKPGKALDVSAKANGYFGVYIIDDGTPAALCGCDIPFAGYAGSALSMLPSNTAKDSIKANDLTAVMLGNLHEIMNICTRLILRENSPHLRLRQVCAMGALPADASALLGSARRRVDMQVDIAKYGSGILCVICA
jgi:hypothetical protein